MAFIHFKILLAAAVLGATLSAQTADPFAYKPISELQVSPDGSTALFTVSSTDLQANKTTVQLMKMPTHGGAPAEVSEALEGANEIRWAPDSKEFAYIAQNAIWVQQLAGGKPSKICVYDRSNAFLSKAGAMLAWSPDGKYLVFAGTIEPKPSNPDPFVTERIQYKTRTSLWDARRTHLFLVSSSGGSPRLLTPGNFDEHSIDWTAGNEIVFVSNHLSDPDSKLNYDIFAVEPVSGRIRQITKTPGTEFDPHISPDGRSVCYLATTREVTTIDSVAEDTHVWMVPLAGGKPKELNAAQDRRSASPAWSPDGETVYFLASDHGKTLLYKTPRAGGESRGVFDKKAQISAYSPAGHDILFVLSDPLHAPEVYSLDAQLTHVNDMPDQKLSAPENLSFRSFDGTQVEGWLYPALNQTAKSPMILTIHGGPHGQFGYAYNPVFQTFAARGYATLAINPRGSSGYGQKFSDGTLNNWGGGDYKDLMAGVDEALKKHPNIDSTRLGVTGGSYGGYMTNWVITQTNRFKAAVAVASVSDLISFYATSLYQDLVHVEFGGFPWTGRNFELLWRWSPMAHVANASTPTLFIHGEQDNDVHITQAEEMYTALRRRGVTAELARYPREGHAFHEPSHQADSRARTLAWMDRFLH